MYCRIKTWIEPLTIAANITQAPHTRCDHVLLTLGNLYRIYGQAHVPQNVRDNIRSSLEARWDKVDQNVFILAVFLNPYIRGRCFSLSVITQMKMLTIAKEVYMRVFQKTSVDSDFLRAFGDYYRFLNEYSKEAMCLDDMKQLYKEKVSSNLLLLDPDV